MRHSSTLSLTLTLNGGGLLKPRLATLPPAMTRYRLYRTGMVNLWHVRKMAHGKISLAYNIQCCPNFFISLPNQHFCPVKSMCIHIPDYLEMVYELPLLPNNTASETFLHNSGVLWSVNWKFLTGAPAWQWLGEYMTLEKTFQNLFKQAVAAGQVTPSFSSLSCSSRRTSISNII